MSMQQMLLGAGGLPPTTYAHVTFTGRLWNASAGGDYQALSSISASGGPGGGSNILSGSVSGGTHSHTSNYLSAQMNTLYTWTCPSGVESIDVLCIGAGGGGAGGGKWEYYLGDGEGSWGEQIYEGYGGSGGSLIYKNNIPVTAGTAYYVAVGTAGAPGPSRSDNQGYVGYAGGPSWFGTGYSGGSNSQYSPSGSWIKADGGIGGGLSSGGSAPSGDSTGTGYTGHTLRTGGVGGRGGGGAAGYSGNGGTGAGNNANGTAGSGGGGGGGALRGSWSTVAAGGGGVGRGGQGSNGAGGTFSSANYTNYTGKGGSYLAWGGGDAANRAHGGAYGGGGGGGYELYWGGWGGIGAVRILWSSDSSARSYPSTNTSNL